MEKLNNVLPKPYMKIKDSVMLELMEEYPPFRDSELARQRQKELKKELEIKIRVITHNGRYFLYRVIANKQCRK